ncbi:MAG: DNA polymerase III subunit delta [Putridiphycobacter sp.]
MSYKDIIKQIKKKDFKPIYFLNGEEPFYIDEIVNYIAKNVLDESERDFNQTVVYAKDTPPLNVVDAASRLPMMSEYQVVIVKEAQEYKTASQWEVFEKYFEAPSKQTILVFAYKYKKFDKRSKIYKILKKTAVIFESEGVKDYQLENWIKDYIKGKNYLITDKATALLAEFVGNDLGRLANELEKLSIIVPEGQQINEKHIEENIGISKDYNVFELVNAVMIKDSVKALKIVNYFEKNPKATHITVVLANLLTLYQRLFKAHFIKSANPAQVASALKIAPYPAKLILSNKSKHPPKIISRNFSYLREYDLLAKGVGSAGADQVELMKELIFKILH